MRGKGAKLTKRQKGFAKDYAMTGNGLQSAIKNYNVDTKGKNYQASAATIAYQNLQKPDIIQAIEVEQKRLADRIPDDLIEQKHLELLNKQEVITKEYPDGTIEVLRTGEIDVQAVAKGLDMAYKVKGVYEETVRHKITGIVGLIHKLEAGAGSQENT